MNIGCNPTTSRPCTDIRIEYNLFYFPSLIINTTPAVGLGLQERKEWPMVAPPISVEDFVSYALPNVFGCTTQVLSLIA
jgi:hypothetical protein